MRTRESISIILLLTLPVFVSAAAAETTAEEQHSQDHQDYLNPKLIALQLTDLKGLNHERPASKSSWKRLAVGIPMSLPDLDPGEPYGKRSTSDRAGHPQDQTSLIRPDLEQMVQSPRRAGLNAAARRITGGFRTVLKQLSSSYRRGMIRIDPVDAEPPGPPETYFVRRRR